MMNKLLLPFLVIQFLYGANVVGKENKLTVVDKRNIMFLAHFNSSPEPDFYHGKYSNFAAEITSGGKGLPLKNSSPTPECLNLNISRSGIAFSGKGNIDIKKGTLQFWVKPRWKESKYLYALFFKFCSSPEKRANIEWRGNNAFLVGKPPRRNALFAGQENCSITKDISPSQDSWYQIAITWDAKIKKKKLYVNGTFVGSQKYLIPDGPPNEIVLGSPGWRYDSHCLLDEMRILNIVLSPKQIMQDYNAQKNGLEFESPEKTQSYSPQVYSPLPPSQTSDRTGYMDYKFYAARTNKRITVDGKLDEEVWKTAPPITDLKTRIGQTEKNRTIIRILYDDKNIYFGVKAEEPDMKNLLARYDQHDLPVYSDDCFEAVIDTKNSYNTFFHFVANTIGGIYDAKAGRKSWSSRNSLSRGIRGSNGWSIELKIPFRDLNVKTPMPGELWGLRVGRQCKPGHYSASLPAVKTGGYNARKYIGKLIFKSLDGKEQLCEVKCNAENFLPGMNKIKLFIRNTGKKEMMNKVAVTISCNKNNIIFSKSQNVSLKPNENKTLTLSVPVQDDSANNLSITVYSDKMVPLWNKKLESAFKRVTPSVSETEKMLPMLKRDIMLFDNIKHPVYKGTVKSVNKIAELIKDFKEKIKKCVDRGQHLPSSEWEKIIAEVNGFNSWLENRRFLIWQTSPWQYGSPKQLPPIKYEENPAVNFVQAGNEREAVVFAVSGLLTGSRLDIRFVPCGARNTKNFIPGDKFHIYYEPFVDNGFGKVISAPLIEADGNIISLSPGTTQRIWLVLDSRGVPAGNYKGSLKIKSLMPGLVADKNIPLNIKIWNFTLPETDKWPLDCFLWNSMRTVTDETAMMRLMHKYHIKWTMALAGNYTRGFVEKKLNYNSFLPKKSQYNAVFKTADGKSYKTYFNPERIEINDDFFKEAKRLKMKVVFAWGNSSHPDWRKLMMQHLLTLGMDYKDVLFQAMRDEFTTKHLKEDIFFLKKIHRADPKIQLMATYYSAPPPAGATLEQLKEPAKYVKVWNLISNFLWGPNEKKKKMLDFFRKSNRTIWSYRCSRQLQDQSLLKYVRFYPWLGYMAGLDGISYWVSMSSRNDPFDHKDGYDEGFLFRGQGGKPVSTKRFEALREGLEDVAYMDILKNILKKMKKRYPGRDFSKYEMLLKKLPEQIIRNNSQQDVDEWRMNIGTAIDKLIKQDN